ncbi:unnamed protein product, partial [Schistocephalus solidus]|uniref:DH domain-containing protein n=1 Tax=Schistocephalus solidus TaxID=70667 RepID=A0A183SEK4_SCHSO
TAVTRRCIQIQAHANSSVSKQILNCNLSNIQFVKMDKKSCSEETSWCTNDPRCRRLKLTDLLIAPLQHYAKIPLLLGNIRRYTENEKERDELTQALGKVETSLKKMSWLHNVGRLQALQKQLIWPSVLETNPRIFIPEFLRKMLSRQPCERILANPKRKLIHEGFLTIRSMKWKELSFSNYLILLTVFVLVHLIRMHFTWKYLSAKLDIIHNCTLITLNAI